jgi:hypothetical protein
MQYPVALGMLPTGASAAGADDDKCEKALKIFVVSGDGEARANCTA